MRSWRNNMVLAVLVFLVACSSNKVLFVPVLASAEKGSVVYIYRPIKAANVMLTPDVSIAGIKTFAMSNGDYKQLYLSPGQHAIKLAAIEGNTPAVEHVLKVVEGRVHYLRVDASMKLEFGQSYQPYKRKFELLNVIANTAVAEISDCTDMDAGEKQKKSAASVEAGDSEEATFSVDKTTNPFSH
ncbi:MAG: DUF2846 domain-containing protein [Gammaproteobacteria bacterium]